jgi:hypothetical protein
MDLVNDAAVPTGIAGKILIVRGQRVLLDTDLAGLYGVTTKAFNQAVRRNQARFPPDFAFQLTDMEAKSSRSQFVTLNAGRGRNLKYLPLAFTEHGAIMAATILNSSQAIAMSVHVVRTFTRLKAMLTTNAQLARKLDALEKSVAVLDADTKRQFKELRAVVFSLAAPATREH